MSGICAIAQARADVGLLEPLERLTSGLEFRGPDGRGTWHDDVVGLGHTLLATDDASTSAPQPRSLDGRAWIAADARIDAQARLRDELARAGRVAAPDAGDADLIVHAWAAWGEACVDHLIGDFAFAIWDQAARTLFCARDHWGIKPFFYAATVQGIVASNTFETVLDHPAVDASLDEVWIGDFLLFGASRDPAASARAAIRRLPAAHCLTWTPEGGAHVRRYWMLPDEWGMPRENANAVEEVRHVLSECVADRLRTRTVGIELSGGLDSSSVAAIAHALLARDSRPFAMQAQTTVCDSLVESNERHYATLVAHRLGIPIHYLIADDPAVLQTRAARARQPEPIEDVKPAFSAAMMEQAIGLARVFLTGWDGDALLDESPKPYLRAMWRSGQRGRAAAKALHYAIWRRKIPKPAWLGQAQAELPPAFPAWIEPGFEARAHLRERWDEALHERLRDHPIRPHAYGRLELLQQRFPLFEGYDAGRTGWCVDYRHPMLDLRFVRCALSLPPTPWCVKKEALRQASRGLLPDAVIARPKEPWPALQSQRELERALAAMGAFQWPARAGSYVVHARVSPLDRAESRDARPVWLADWLRQAPADKDESHPRIGVSFDR